MESILCSCFVCRVNVVCEVKCYMHDLQNYDVISCYYYYYVIIFFAKKGQFTKAWEHKKSSKHHYIATSIPKGNL